MGSSGNRPFTKDPNYRRRLRSNSVLCSLDKVFEVVNLSIAKLMCNFVSIEMIESRPLLVPNTLGQRVNAVQSIWSKIRSFEINELGKTPQVTFENIITSLVKAEKCFTVDNHSSFIV